MFTLLKNLLYCYSSVNNKKITYIYFINFSIHVLLKTFYELKKILEHNT